VVSKKRGQRLSDLTILYIAYSCSPIHGSEDKIGWKVPVECAKNNKVIVVTKEEQREYITQYLIKHPMKNIRFVYVDIPAVYKRMFRGALYSGRLAVWNHIAFKTVREICAREKVDVIHQITPVEFRSVGSYGKIPGIKFVFGPIAGGQNTPKALKDYTRKHAAAEWVRTLVNSWCIATYRLNGKLNLCSYLMIANRETRDYLNNHLKITCPQAVLTDVSVAREDLVRDLSQMGKSDTKCRFLVVGRMVYLKGHAFLLDALRRIPSEMQYECSFVGEGIEQESLKRKCSEYGLENKVFFPGQVAHAKIGDIYQKADVLIMPSLREATGSVLLEAMAGGLPVVTINRFGGAAILDETCGWLYDGEDKESCIEMLKSALIDCIQRPEEVVRRGINARKMAEKYTWDARMEEYQMIYEAVLSK